MTSPQAAALDVAPAIATPTIAHTATVAKDVVDLTAEAQAEPLEPAADVSSQQEPLDETNNPQGSQESQVNDGVGPAEPIEGEIQQPPQEHAVDLTGVADASIPNLDGLHINQYGQPLNQLEQPDIASLLASLKDFNHPETLYGINTLGMSAIDFNAMSAMQMSLGQQPYDDLDPEPVAEELQVQAYAKLEFADGAYYMNTYSVDLGRDQVAAKKALKREKMPNAAGVVDKGSPFATHPAGILAPEDDPDDGERRSKKSKSRKSRASKNSLSSRSSRKKSRRDSKMFEPGVYPIQQSQRAGSDTGPSVNAAALRPPADDCPLVGIHPANSACFQAYKNISRRHVKIAFNSDSSMFELHVLGRNGCFLGPPDGVMGELELKAKGTKHTLYNGSKLQIGEVALTFLLPTNNVTEASNHANNESPQAQDTTYRDDDRYHVYPPPLFKDARGKEMSLDHTRAIRADAGPWTDEDEENSLNGHQRESGLNDTMHGDNEIEESEEGEEDGDEDEASESEEDDEEAEEEDEEEQTQAEMPRQSIEEDASPDTKAKVKRKGPGRPPKDGVSSTREKKERQKAAKEGAASQKPGVEGSEAPKKGKVGRPRKHPLPDPETANKPKRKYTKRKPKENPEGNAEGAASGGDGTAAAPKVKKEKPFKPPRSPTPVYNVEELTEEQMTKPAENYVVVIYNAMMASPHKEMGLPQIYNAIKRAYPWFALRAETKGWESSVRHNLSGNPDVFEKGQKDGKGHMWSLKPGASIDKERKKKAPAEPQFQGHPQIIQQAPQNMHGQHPGMPYGYANFGPPPNANYPMGQQPPFMPHQGPPFPPQQNGFQPPPPPPNWQPGQPGPYPPYIPAALAPPPAGTSYSSPYTQKSAESDGPQPNGQPQHPPNGPSQLPEQHAEYLPEQKHVQQPSPPATVSHQPQAQFAPHHHNPYPLHPQAPYPQMPYGPIPPPHQYSMPPNGPPPASYPPPGPPINAQHLSQTLYQPLPQPPPVQQLPQPSPIQQPSQPSSVQQPSPPQQPQEKEPLVSTTSASSIAGSTIIDLANMPTPERVDKMLEEFEQLLLNQNNANAEVIKIAVSILKEDGDKAVPNPALPNPAYQKTVIDTLRSALSAIAGSGFTAPPPQRSFQPFKTSAPPSPSVNGNGNSISVKRPPSTTGRGSGGSTFSRPPIHTSKDIKRTVSGSPVARGTFQRQGSVSVGGSPSIPAGGATPFSAQGASIDSLNGANAATSTPVSAVSEAMIKTLVPAAVQSTPVPPVERPAPADVDVTMSVSENDKGINVNGQPQEQQEQIVGRKRSRDEVVGLATEGQENVKRVAV